MLKHKEEETLTCKDQIWIFNNCVKSHVTCPPNALIINCSCYIITLTESVSSAPISFAQLRSVFDLVCTNPEQCWASLVKSVTARNKLKISGLMFKCTDGHLVGHRSVSDGFPHCPDKSDEDVKVKLKSTVRCVSLPLCLSNIDSEFFIN